MPEEVTAKDVLAEVRLLHQESSLKLDNLYKRLYNDGVSGDIPRILRHLEGLESRLDKQQDRLIEVEVTQRECFARRAVTPKFLILLISIATVVGGGASTLVVRLVG